MDTQTRNKEIADGLVAAGVDEDLVWKRAWECPAGHVLTARAVNDSCLYYDEATRTVCGQDVRRSHIALDFLDPRYLEKAIDAYCEETGHGYTVQRFFDPDDGVLAVIYAGPLQDWTGRAAHGQSTLALANALHAAVTQKGAKTDA